jgi:hypothetical protein
VFPDCFRLVFALFLKTLLKLLQLLRATDLKQLPKTKCFLQQICFLNMFKKQICCALLPQRLICCALLPRRFIFVAMRFIFVFDVAGNKLQRNPAAAGLRLRYIYKCERAELLSSFCHHGG